MEEVFRNIGITVIYMSITFLIMFCAFRLGMWVEERKQNKNDKQNENDKQNKNKR